MKRFKSLFEYVCHKYPHDEFSRKLFKRDPILFELAFEKEKRELERYNSHLEVLETIPIFYKMGLIS